MTDANLNVGDVEPGIESTLSADGTRIGWERIGRGPAIVVAHGGTRAGKHYRALALAMAHKYSLILYDRRGRGHSGAGQDRDGLAIELADLKAVLAATGAERVFGHSAGALISLEAALRLPIRQLALFEPPCGALPLAWVPAFEAALAAGDMARAMVLFVQGLEMGPRWIPAWLMALPLRLILRGPAGRELVSLIKTLPRDLHMVRTFDRTPNRYAQLSCRTLILDGTDSPGYLREAAAVLHRTIPAAQRTTIAGVGHNAPDLQAPREVAGRLLAFFD